MARVFCSLGIIEHPVVKEYRGVDLKGSYVGQTKDVVNRIFETSAGCVVIIDEVYSLYDPHAGNQDSFGREAIDTLVGCITDPRNVTTIVVLAGYKDRMDVFLTANPGLLSRFGTEIEFPDYTDEECVRILFRKYSLISRILSAFSYCSPIIRRHAHPRPAIPGTFSVPDRIPFCCPPP